MTDTPPRGIQKHEVPDARDNGGGEPRGALSRPTAADLYPLLVESVRDYAIFALDPTGRVVTWNLGAERINGYRAEEIIGRHFSVFYPAERVAEGFPQHELDAAASAGRFEDEGWRIRKDGSRVWANVVITALRDAEGRLVGFAKVTRDLTERRAAEEQARRLAAEEAARAEAERRSEELRTLSEELQNQGMELEQQTEEAQSLAEELELTNDELQHALADAVEARERAEAGGRRAMALLRVSEALVGALSAREVAREIVHHGRSAVGAAAGSLASLAADAGEFQTIATEGYDERTSGAYARFPLVRGRPISDVVLREVPAYVSSLDEFCARYPAMAGALRGTGFEGYVALPVRTGGRVVAGLSFSFTERREFDADDRAFFETLAAQAGQALERAHLIEAERTARAEAESARTAAEEASRAKSEFLTTMSHELRTPLNAIAGYAELLDMGLRGPVTPEQREDLSRIRRSQAHLMGLINEVLNFARLESRMVAYELAPTSLAEVIAATVPLVEPPARAKRIALEVMLPEAPGGPQPRVLADAEKLEQILLNLLSNAVKFTPEGGRVTVELLADPDARGRAVLRVRDTGIGVPDDKLEAIFEPFVQIGRSLSSPGEGTGLGLAISRDLARGMGGDLTAESVLGSGSTFTLALPRA